MEKKVINDEYWLGIGYDLIKDGLTRIYSQISSVNQYINGLLGTYVLVSLVESIYLEISSPWKFLIIIAPVIIVNFGKWYGMIAKMPKVNEFYPSSPESCEDAYYDYFDRAEKQLRILKIWALIGTISMVVALIFVAFSSVKIKTDNEVGKLKNQVNELSLELDSLKESDIYQIETRYILRSKKLLLTGTLPKQKVVHLVVADSTANRLIHDAEFLVGKRGFFNHNVILSDVKKSSEVHVILSYYVNDSEQHTIKKKINLSKE